MFLIRDWRHLHSYGHGLEEGTKYIERILNVDDNTLAELTIVREYIYDSFENIHGYLLPSPGKVVETGIVGKDKKTYDGRWSQMDEDFKDYLMELIDWLLNPSKLKVKQINGNDILCSEMKEYLEIYFEMFLSETSPKADSIYEVTVEKTMSILQEKLMEQYEENLVNNLDPTRVEFAKHISDIHEQVKSFIATLFDVEKKMGASSHAEKYKKLLEQKMDRKFIELREYALKDHRRFKEEKDKIEAAMKDKVEDEKKLLMDVQMTLEKITQLEASKRKLSSDEYKTSMENLKQLQLNQQSKVDEYRIKKEKQEMLNVVIAIQKESQERESKIIEEMAKRQKEFEENHERLSEEQKQKYESEKKMLKAAVEDMEVQAKKAKAMLKESLASKQSNEMLLNELKDLRRKLAQQSRKGFFGSLGAAIDSLFGI